jgi:hypothetical protein
MPAMLTPPDQRPTVFGALRLLGGWAGYQIEHAFVVALEAIQQLFDRFDRRVYSEAMRIRSIGEGGDHKAGGKFFVLVIYCTDALPAFTRTLIDAVTRSPFNLVIVSNARLTDGLAAELRSKCRLLIERNNIGRDFGGYKDGVAVVLRRFNVERLVIANDSVFYLREGLDELLAKLDGPHDLIGVSEVYDHHYHVASFLMSFGRRVVESAAFRDFWRRYKPLGSRRWAIFRGEGDLSAQLLRGGFRPHILYRAVHLRPYLADDHAVMPLLPLQVRAWLAGRGEARSTTLLHKIGVALKWLRGAPRPKPEGADLVIDEVMGRNQMHAAGLMFRKFLGLPLIKRDLYYRGVYSLDDLAVILADQPPDFREEIMADLRRRGNSERLGPFGRLLHRHA